MTQGAQRSLFIAIVFAAFLAGLFSAPNHSRELEKQWKKERDMILDKIVEKQIEITRLQADSAAVRNKMRKDSLYFVERLSENQRAYNALKKKYNEINLSRATSAQLDSLIGVLFPD